MAISFVEKLAYINKNAKGDENLLKAVKYGRGIDKIQDEEKKKKVKDLVNKAFMKIKELNTSKTKDPKKKIEAEIEKFKKSIGRTKWLTATRYMTNSGLRKTTIEKDAVLSALPKGKRISRKTGKPYWENRANRTDVKQPPKTYPKLADGGKINMDDIKKRAIFYTDESKWSTKPTISKFQEENKELKETLKKLENKEITPSKIIGGGYKSSAIARKLAFQYLEERILVNDMAIEILKERGEKFAKGGEVGEKPLSYYKYETPKVKIAWKGKIQPLGMFKSAEEAMEVIKKQINGDYEELKNYAIVTPDKVLHYGKEFQIRYAKGGEVGQKVFVAEEDGILGIADGSDAYSIEISKGDTFVTYGEQDDMNWWYVKKVNKKPNTMSESNDFDYTKSKSRVKVNWDELLLTFPKGDKMIYAQMIESKAKGGEISVYNLRKGDKVKTRNGKIETILRKTGSGSYETEENDYSHSPESLEFVSRPKNKMAKDGEMRMASDGMKVGKLIDTERVSSYDEVYQEELVNSFVVKYSDEYARIIIESEIFKQENDYTIYEGTIHFTEKGFLKIYPILQELREQIVNKKYGHGGTIAEGNYHMILSQAKEVKHHVAELQDILKNQKDIDAWVVAKMENASSTLSDITHYLDGKTEKK